MKQQHGTLKEEVRKMFSIIDDNIPLPQKLNFIDSVQRLGVSYHFEHEIEDALEQVHNIYTNSYSITHDGELHTLALLFRLLRQQGYRISSGIICLL